MKNKVPAYVIKDLEKLNKHLAAVARLNQNIESWVEKNTNEDPQDFFYCNKLDNPFEFDLEYTLEQLEKSVSEGQD